ncbi:VQ protein [Dillenia turbinata]|uniref:VQ protein n=1 Tax=Dillenia turbinata TaxID=194707 RepID=A0AAN8W5C9_9MAGN
MDGMMKKQTCMLQSSTPSAALSMHKDSQTISKTKPKIRIIHIFAPEIIKTDVANFRELVQRLTGKPTERDSTKNKKVRMIRRSSREEIKTTLDIEKSCHLRSDHQRMIKSDHHHHHQEELWRGENSGGFLGGLADLDGFIQEINGFPLIPLEANHGVNHQVDHAFGDLH